MSNPAPVFSLAGEARLRADAGAWAQFSQARDAGEFHQAWLAVLCAQIGRVSAALLVLGEEGAGGYGVAAVWPDRTVDVRHLGPVAERALKERRGFLAGRDGAGPGLPGEPARVGYPIEVGGALRGAVVIELPPSTQQDMQNALRLLHWASAWLLDHFRQQALAVADQALARTALLNQILATALEQPQLRPSALAVANELALRLHCDRVSVGMERQDRIVPLVLSHTATFDARQDLLRALAEAMDEVLDLGEPVLLPRLDGDELGALAHEQAAQVLNAQAMLSLPILHEGRTIGVVTLERQQPVPFDSESRQIAEAVVTLLGPVWALQQQAERSGLRRAADAARDGIKAVFGPRRPGLKLAASLLGVALLTMFLWQTEYRVSARTAIEGEIQLARVAPFDGYVAQGFVRAGDTVRAGQPMARLEDRDLKLERARWQAERDQAQHKVQVALAQADRGSMGVAAAQAQQAEAQLALIEERLARAEINAPFDGIVIAGDLSQLIGTPVEQGKTLFEVAPLAGYRVVLQVDDRDIARVAVGQQGELLLSSLPDRSWPFTVRSVTSVATQHDGRNVFRVEAQMQGDAVRLRPGMEGIGKIAVGQHSLLWIWTHSFVDWLRVALWSWMP